MNKNNHYGFEGDPWIEDAVIRAIKVLNPNIFIETGSFIGSTTRKLGLLLKLHNQVRIGDKWEADWQLYSAEMNKEFHAQAKATVRIMTAAANLMDKVFIIRANSGDATRMILSGRNKHRAIFYLDAHWGAPVIFAELNAIYSAVREGWITYPIIFIHDWHVPRYEKQLKFEKMDKKPLGHRLLLPWVEGIYGVDNYVHLTNTPALSGGQHCGCGVYFPSDLTDSLMSGCFGANSFDGHLTGNMNTFEELLAQTGEKVALQDQLSRIQIDPGS